MPVIIIIINIIIIIITTIIIIIIIVIIIIITSHYFKVVCKMSSLCFCCYLKNQNHRNPFRLLPSSQVGTAVYRKLILHSFYTGGPSLDTGRIKPGRTDGTPTTETPPLRLWIIRTAATEINQIIPSKLQQEVIE